MAKTYAGRLAGLGLSGRLAGLGLSGRLAGLLLVAVLPGCALFEAPPRPAAPPAPVEQPPLVTDRFTLVPGTDVVGELQVIRARHEDTFLDIARAYDIGYDELVAANPGVDPWLPGAGTRIVLPTQFVLPDAPREGIVLNLAAKRLFYFPKPAPGDPREVITHPIGIGREGWQTPLGATKVVAKQKDPVWVVPASIRREHAEAGDPLPARVGPGPDNPLGRYALRLGFPSYLIHGTNKPDGIGMRVSHGCIQLFPEDIESLFGLVPVGTPVRIVNQPHLAGWRGDNLYLEVHPPLEDDRRFAVPAKARADVDALLRKRLAAGAPAGASLDTALVGATVGEGRGFPVPLLAPAAGADSVAARARPTRNVLADVPADGPAAGATGPAGP
jgi:L,D-transpeptidase ErfK/SrfK